MVKRIVLCLTLFLILVFGVVGWHTLPLLSQPLFQPMSAAIAQMAPGVLPANNTAAGGAQAALDRIYAQVSPSVVMIHVADNIPSRGFRRRGFSSGTQGSQAWDGLGSGFVWDTNGDIVTNNHVVAGAVRLAVTFADGTTVPAQVVGTDPGSDLAVIKVSAAAGELHPVTLANSAQLKVGQTAIAIGSPFGQQNKMTTGTVSGLGQSLPVSDGTYYGPTYVIPNLIQTDAPINPGNSGGVLLDDQGRVIGVTNAIESRSGTWAGIGFAIPSDTVGKVVPVLIQAGHYAHPWLGVSGHTLDAETAQQLGLSPDQSGAVLMSVVQGSPADKAGLQAGDLITAIGGQSVQSFDDVVAYLTNNASVGQTVALSVVRNGQNQAISVTLGARPGE